MFTRLRAGAAISAWAVTLAACLGVTPTVGGTPAVTPTPGVAATTGCPAVSCGVRFYAMGNHTRDHPDMDDLTAAQQAAELDEAAAEQRSITGTGDHPVLPRAWLPLRGAVNQRRTS